VVRIAYLGPEGTFTEAALLQITASGLVPEQGTDTRPLPLDSTPAALNAVRDGDAEYACVPIENSIDGSVMPTLDSLAIGSPLQVFAETTLDVAFSIVVKPGRSAADVHTLAAFPVALAQVREAEFAIRGIDLTRIESRPTRTELGTYLFFADCVGHIDDSAVAEALKALHRRCADVRYLGSWPTGSVPGVVPPPADEASRWLTGLREGKPEQALEAGAVEP